MPRTVILRPRGARVVLLGLLAALLALSAPPVPAHAADTTRPFLSFIRFSSNVNDAVVTWWTDEPTNAVALYGPTKAYGKTSSEAAAPSLRHGVILSGLKAGQTYHFQLRSTDAAGNTGVSADRVITTETRWGFDPGNKLGAVEVPSGLGLEDVSHPDHVVGDGTAASCTSAALVAAVKAGGVVTFRCGAYPVVITLDETLKVRSGTSRLVLDGGGWVTLSGARQRRILYVDTCDPSLGTVSGNCRYAPDGPRVTVQNLTFSDGDATNASYVAPGGTSQASNGGGAIFQLGGHLKVVRSFFSGNRCATSGPGIAGAAVQVLAQHSPTPDDLDASNVARNQEPASIAQSTFGAGGTNTCSNGGAVSASQTPLTVVDGWFIANHADGCCASPPHTGTPGGGSGGAISTVGAGDLRVLGSRFQENTAKAGGSAISYVSSDHTGHLVVEDTTSELNQYLASGYTPSDQHFETFPGIYYVGDGAPSFVRSTIR